MLLYKEVAFYLFNTETVLQCLLYIAFCSAVAQEPEAGKCLIAECDTMIINEHAAQVSLIQYSGFSEGECLSKLKLIQLSDFSAVYCPEIEFCGLDLSPELTSGFKVLANRTCVIYARDENECAQLEKSLYVAGKFSNVPLKLEINSREPDLFRL